MSIWIAGAAGTRVQEIATGKQAEIMSGPASQDKVRATRHEVDPPLSNHGAFGAAMCWLVFYALAVVSALATNFDQVIRTTMTAMH
jgi:hypothetical protein